MLWLKVLICYIGENDRFAEEVVRVSEWVSILPAEAEAVLPGLIGTQSQTEAEMKLVF